MDVQELKFLLKLIGFTDARAPIAKLKPNPETKAPQRDRIARQLRDRDLVDYHEEILKFAIAPPGKSLLQLDTQLLPISEEEVQLLQACAEHGITPAQTGLPLDRRDSIVQSLLDRGLIQAEKTQIKQVWLTRRGEEYLREEYTPNGNTPVLSLDLLANYLRFMRKSLGASGAIATSGDFPLATASPSPPLSAETLTDDEILRWIQTLDRELGTENYLPIFQLRQQLQPPLSREAFDGALYRLQRSDRIELSSLQEASSYTPEQIEGGIAQDIGGPLFFIIVNG
jgi:hypothetical protein